MKARVKATGEIVEAKRICQSSQGPIWEAEGSDYYEYELDFDNLDFPDYWTRLEHTYAGMAMQGILSNQDYCRLLIDEDIKGSFAEDVSRCASGFAHALVEKMKEEKK